MLANSLYFMALWSLVVGQGYSALLLVKFHNNKLEKVKAIFFHWYLDDSWIVVLLCDLWSVLMICLSSYERSFWIQFRFLMPYSCSNGDDGKEEYLGIRGHDCLKTTVAGLDWQATTYSIAHMRIHFSHAVFLPTTLMFILVVLPSLFLIQCCSLRAVWWYRE